MELIETHRFARQLPLWKRILSRLSAEGLVVLAVGIWWLLSLELPEIIIVQKLNYTSLISEQNGDLEVIKLIENDAGMTDNAQKVLTSVPNYIFVG